MEGSPDGGRPGSSYSVAANAPVEGKDPIEAEADGAKSPSRAVFRRQTALAQVANLSEDSESEEPECVP